MRTHVDWVGLTSGLASGGHMNVRRNQKTTVARATAVVALSVAAVLVAGCQSGQGTAAPFEATADPMTPVAAVSVDRSARITIAPGDNTVGVPLDAVVAVTADGGTLTDVKVSASDGSRVTGGYGARRTVWESDDPLAPHARYRVEATAVNAEGRSRTDVQTFKAISPKRVLGASIVPDEGSRVGVGQPIVVKFTEEVKDKAAVERRLHVQTSRPVDGAWRWFGDREIHYRPRTYWPAFTKVKVRADLRGVRSGAGTWGIANKVRTFAITESVVTKVDLTDHQARVYIGGEHARTIPVTGGKPGWRTRQGIKVVLQKRENLLFRNEAIGEPQFYRLRSRWGLRVTWSGEFIHSADWSRGSQGAANTSHGCVGMSTWDSGWLWRVSHVGDPVEVRSPGGDRMEPTNGYGDWNFSWREWREGSALG